MWPFSKKVETREQVATSDPFLGEFLGARWTARADIDRASGHAVAHRCIQTVSEALASVPLKLYRKTENGGRDTAGEHPLYRVLHDQMNPALTAFEGREWLIASVLTQGNAYARIERNGDGQVVALYPLTAGSVTVEVLKNGRLRYKHAQPDGGARTYLQDEILHLRYRTVDGVLGMSPIQIAAAAFGLAIAQQDQAGAAAENAFRPSGVLSFPQKLGGPGKEDALDKFRTRFIGQLKANDPIVLDGGATWSPIAMSAKDAEALESRKLSNYDIARVFGVPPSVAGIVEGQGYGSLSEESRVLVQRCLAPMAKRIEAAMNSALLTEGSRKTFLIEHDLAGLLRGDLASRYTAYRVGREGGWLNVNEIRHLENMPAIGEDGDAYIQPLNMGLVGANDNKGKMEEAA